MFKFVSVKGTVLPDPQIAARYEERYNKFKCLYPSLKDVFKKYDGTSWSDKRVSPIYLLHLGIAAGAITPPNLKLKACIFSDDLRETLSPKDPDFPEWWEYNKSKWEKR